MAACTSYFEGDELAASTWMNKYAMKEGDYFLELTPDDMHGGWPLNFARIEKKYEAKNNAQRKSPGISSYGQSRATLDEQAIGSLFAQFKYLVPQGSVMGFAGKQACAGFLFKLHCASRDPRFLWRHFSYRPARWRSFSNDVCGVGIDISTIRPAGMKVSNAARTTTGAASFMERFSNTTREVAQNGRRGALMITMDVAHPDIEQFVSAKSGPIKSDGSQYFCKAVG
jgi:ribonucleoside-diphosphate reductase alpha chain